MARSTSLLKIIMQSALLAAALCVCARPSGAQVTLLTLRPLRDGGGLARGLSMRLTTALLRFLNDHSERAFGAAITPIPAPLAPATRYTLEGELSCANGQGEDNARFLLVTRLYREDARRVLVGQWAGTADTLRCLTVNLRHDPRFHALGLVGEVGSRIVAALAAESASAGGRWRKCLSRLTVQNASAEIVPVNEEGRVLKQIPADAPFHLRMRGGVPTQAYLFVSGINGDLRVLPVSGLSKLSKEEDTIREGAMRTEDGKTALSQAITLPEASADVWAVYRVPPEKVQKSAFGRGERRHVLCSLKSNTHNQADDSPVHVLDGVGNGAPAPGLSAELTRLLDAIAREPAMWRVARLRVVLPQY